MLHADLATHYCQSSQIPKLEKALLDLKDTKHVDDVINEFCSKPNSEFSLSKNLDQINRCFDASSVEEILTNLEKDNSEWAKQTIKVSKLKSENNKIVSINVFILNSKKIVIGSSKAVSDQCKNNIS